jgi:alpha-D-xyloside xylohydrolase
MGHFAKVGKTLLWREAGQLLELSGWGRDTIRVRATRNAGFADVAQALTAAEPGAATMTIGDGHASLRSGSLEARVSSFGRVQFFRDGAAEPLLEESEWNPSALTLFPASREFLARDGGLFRVEVRFKACKAERFYGLGQHKHGLLDQKGAVIDFIQRNGEVCIPFLLSSRGYGLLWNNPGIGRVELAANGTRWVADGARQADYVVFGGDTLPAVMERYAEATGHAPPLPAWASGFWQCKLRYASQEELLTVAREFKKRALPLSVIVVDFFHWTRQGEWEWDPVQWPDPAAMIRELDAMGVKCMVSVWPSVNPRATTAREMKERGMLTGTDRGTDVLFSFAETREKPPSLMHYYDPTNPEARAFIWDRVKKSYHDAGVALYWLDACEPEIHPCTPDNLRFHAGPGVEVANIYPLMHQRAFYEGMRAAGRTDVLTLCRSAWAGSQRYGAAVWSGDIHSDWTVFAAQVRAGLNMGMSGIPWWTTDIGGFSGGNVNDPGFRELLIRWFQWGTFCPLFRLHGVRDPMRPIGDPRDEQQSSGADNEPWSYGDEAYRILKEHILLRERMRPYIHEQAAAASAKGMPVIRPLFFDYPADAETWGVEDEHLFGPDIIVAPVLAPSAVQREVYLPVGAAWRDAWTGEKRASGEWFSEKAPLERIPVYIREGARVALRQPS